MRVTPTGSKSWALRYRVGRRLRRWTIGDYPTISLADARDQARNALRDVPKGHDPALAKQDRREADTFSELASTYIDEHAKPRKRTWRDDQRLLKNEVLPHWKHRPARDIQHRDVREVIEGVASRGAPILANRLRALLHRLFNFAIEQELVDVNPVAKVRRPGVERQRDRVLTEDEIRTLWQAWEQQPPEMAAAFQLRLITAQRGGEVVSMRWADLDLDGGWWTIPAERSKNKLPHRVPLTAPALEILESLRVRAQSAQKPKVRRGLPKDESKVDNVNLAAAKRSAYVLTGARGKRQRSEAASTFGIPDFIGHDLRRTAASCMAAGGIPRLTISKILNHIERGVTAVYDRHSYDPEKRAALTWWAVRLAAILENKREVRAVVPFARG